MHSIAPTGPRRSTTVHDAVQADWRRGGGSASRPNRAEHGAEHDADCDPERDVTEGDPETDAEGDAEGDGLRADAGTLLRHGRSIREDGGCRR